MDPGPLPCGDRDPRAVLSSEQAAGERERPQWLSLLSLFLPPGRHVFTRPHLATPPAGPSATTLHQVPLAAIGSAAQAKERGCTDGCEASCRPSGGSESGSRRRSCGGWVCRTSQTPRRSEVPSTFTVRLCSGLTDPSSVSRTCCRVLHANTGKDCRNPHAGGLTALSLPQPCLCPEKLIRTHVLTRRCHTGTLSPVCPSRQISDIKHVVYSLGTASHPGH